jgi:hypothetical protein
MKWYMPIVVLACGFLGQQPAFAQERGWLDLNFGVSSPAEDGYTATFEPIIFEERATFESNYSFPSAASFDVGGGYMITPLIGAGLAVGRVTRKDPAELFISIPDQRVFNNNGTDRAETNEDLERSERSVHVQAMFVLMNTPKLRVRAFAGPTYFSVEQHTIEDIGFSQVFLGPINLVEITGFEATPKSDSAWGGHGGADVSYFVTDRLGIGGFLRVSRGTVELDDMGGTTTSEITVGGTEFGVGIRTRF